MTTRRAGPTKGSSTPSRTSVTRPSAGATMAPAVAGGVRSGSRKKKAMKTATAPSTTAVFGQPSQTRARATTSGTRMNGQPSGAIGTIRLDGGATRLGTGVRAVSCIASLHPRRLDPAHHRPEPLAHFLDLVIGLYLPHGQEAGAVGLVLQHPLARELTRLDLPEDLPHLGPGLVGDDPGAAGVVAVLRSVRHR